MQKKLEQKNNEEVVVEDTLFRKTYNIKSTSTELDDIKLEHDFELMYQRSYYHILDRMKKDLIATQLKSAEMQDSFKSKEKIQTEESEKARKAKE